MSFGQSVVNALYPAWRMHVDMDMVHIHSKSKLRIAHLFGGVGVRAH